MAATSWASNAAHAPSSLPQAFLCTKTGRVMTDPVLSLCGHLFERRVVERAQLRCPHDKIDITDYVSCSELKARIQQHYRTNDDSTTEVRNGKDEANDDAQTPLPPLSFPKLIKRAHEDDIHGMIKLLSEEIVTGSKDASMKIWDSKGSVVAHIDKQVRGYKYWNTALSGLSDGTWISGTRDGWLSQWDSEGKELSSWRYNPSPNARNETNSKERNKARINCVTQAFEDDPKFIFTGTPRFIQLWNTETSRLAWHYKAHDNDWVYCIDPLSSNSMLVVIGSTLEAWSWQDDTLNRNTFIDRKPLLSEKKPYYLSKGNREHIASIARLECNQNLLAAASFDGSVKVVDYNKGEIVRTYWEHKSKIRSDNRVWCIANLNTTCFASGAEDATVKIWDVRTPKSVKTIFSFPGRVSTILKYDEGVLLAGSCPKDPYNSIDKGQIDLLDLRQH